MLVTPAITRRAALWGPYTPTIAAMPVRLERPIGSVLKVEWSQTPERIRASANSISTAATPPIARAMGFLKTRQETDAGWAKARSPAGALKSTFQPRYEAISNIDEPPSQPGQMYISR